MAAPRLREAFDYSHAEIAEVLDLTEEHSRQLYRRARRHVGEEHRRFEADATQHARMLAAVIELLISTRLRGRSRGPESHT